MNVYGIYDRVADKFIGDFHLVENDETMMRKLMVLPDGMDGEHFILVRLGSVDGLSIVCDSVKLCKLSQTKAELDNILALKD